MGSLLTAYMGASLLLIFFEGMFRDIAQKTPAIGWFLQLILTLVEIVVCGGFFIYILFH